MWYRVIMPPYQEWGEAPVPCLEATVFEACEEWALLAAYSPDTPKRLSRRGLEEWDAPIIEPASEDMILVALGAARLPGLE